MTRVGHLNELPRPDHQQVDGAEQTRLASKCWDSTPRRTLYWIQPVELLPCVDLSNTLLSSLVCRHKSSTDRLAFNTRVVQFVDRWLTKLQLLVLVSAPVTAAMFFVEAPIAQAAVSITVFCTTMLFITVAYTTLSSDMAKLVVRTFEFWFLTAANIINTMIFISMFRNVRILGILCTSLFLQLTFLTDANLRTRLLELRILVFGAPGIFLVIIACAFRITPGLHVTSFRIWWTSFTDVDLLINSNFNVAFFTARKTHCNRHLLSPKHA